MKKKLEQLYIALGNIETKGESTMVMADCRRFVKQCIGELAEKEKEDK